MDGVNGTVAAGAAGLGDAIVRAVQGGAELQRSTRAWYEEHAHELSAAASSAKIRTELALAGA